MAELREAIGGTGHVSRKLKGGGARWSWEHGATKPVAVTIMRLRGARARMTSLH